MSKRMTEERLAEIRNWWRGPFIPDGRNYADRILPEMLNELEAERVRYDRVSDLGNADYLRAVKAEADLARVREYEATALTALREHREKNP